MICCADNIAPHILGFLLSFLVTSPFFFVACFLVRLLSRRALSALTLVFDFPFRLVYFSIIRVRVDTALNSIDRRNDA